MTSWLQDNVFFLSFFVQYRHYSIFCMHKIQYFSINWRLSGVASRDLQREEEGSMQAFDVSMKQHHKDSILSCFRVIRRV